LKGSKLRNETFAKIKSNFIESVFSEAQGLGSFTRNISAEAQVNRLINPLLHIPRSFVRNYRIHNLSNFI